MSGLGSVKWCVVSDLLAGAALPLTCIRVVACCDQIVHPISDDAPALIGCNAPDGAPCSLTGAAPKKSHAIPAMEPQVLSTKR